MTDARLTQAMEKPYRINFSSLIARITDSPDGVSKLDRDLLAQYVAWALSSDDIAPNARREGHIGLHAGLHHFGDRFYDDVAIAEDEQKINRTGVSTGKPRRSKAPPVWKQHHAPVAHILPMGKAACEVVCYLERAVIHGEGHGMNDSCRGLHLGIPLIPMRLAKRKRLRSKKSYERAIVFLQRVRIIVSLGRNGERRKVYTFRWLLDDEPDIADVFEEAAQEYVSMQATK